MKPVLLALLFALIASTGFSQIYKAQWMLGGTAGFETGKQGDFDNTKYSSFQLNPNAGYFFINNFAGTIGVDF